LDPFQDPNEFDVMGVIFVGLFQESNEFIQIPSLSTGCFQGAPYSEIIGVFAEYLTQDPDGFGVLAQLVKAKSFLLQEKEVPGKKLGCLAEFRKGLVNLARFPELLAEKPVELGIVFCRRELDNLLELFDDGFVSPLFTP
jgi:hypothetical protein